jgi:hypothetical protein
VRRRSSQPPHHESGPRGADLCPCCAKEGSRTADEGNFKAYFNARASTQLSVPVIRDQ